MGIDRSKPQNKLSEDGKGYLPTQSQLYQEPSGLQHSRAAGHETSASKIKSNRDMYLSRLGEQIPENQRQERLRDSKFRHTIVNKEKGQSNIKVNEYTVNVKEQKSHQNSKINANGIPDFESDQLIGKKIKKFTITTIINDRDFVKQSNYFDESHEDDNNIIPSIDKSMVNFKFDQFQTFPVKTYLYDRNLVKKIRP